MQVARKKKNKHFKWAKKVDPKSLFSLIFPIISFLPSPFLTSLILTFLTSGFFASILFCIFHWNTYYRSPHSIPVNLPILNASSLKVYCVYFISFVSHFKCLILNKWLWSKELAYLFGATKMHGGTGWNPSMHLDSQHAPGFSAAAVAAIGQAGGLGRSWGRLFCFYCCLLVH